MQTFLPYPNIQRSLNSLDMRRLGKQRVEAKQILNIFDDTNPSSKWRNHPAVLMWQGYIEVLKLYMNVAIDEWIYRGYKNTMQFARIDKRKLIFPSWWNGEIHRTHRSNLLRKAPEHYGQFGWTEPNDLEYYWPTHYENNYDKRYTQQT